VVMRTTTAIATIATTAVMRKGVNFFIGDRPKGRDVMSASLAISAHPPETPGRLCGSNAEALCVNRGTAWRVALQSFITTPHFWPAGCEHGGHV